MVRTPALGFRERVYCSVEYKVLGAFLDQLRVAELLHPSLAFGGTGVNLFPASRSTRDQQAEVLLPVRPGSIHTCRSQCAPLSSECRSGRQTEAAAFVADELAVCLEPDSLRPVEYPCGPCRHALWEVHPRQGVLCSADTGFRRTGLCIAAALVPPLVILAFLTIVVRRTWWFPRGPKPLDIKALDWSEMTQGAVFGILLSFAFLLL